MKISVKQGATSVTVNVFIQDSSSTVGAGKAGLAFNTASLTAYYMRPRVAATAITLATLAAVTSAYSSGGFKEIDSTNAIGWYRFDIPDACLANAERFVSIHFQGAANMAPLALEIALEASDNQDGVRLGLTALPNAAAEAAGGLYTRGTGAGQIRQDANGRIDANAKAWIDGTIPAVNVTGVPLVDDKYLLGTIYSTPATAGIQDINVKNMNNVAATPITTVKAVQGLTTADTIATYTGNTKQTADVATLITTVGTPAGASLAADLSEIEGETDSIIATLGAAGAGLNAIPDSATLTEINTDVDEIITTIGAAGAGLTGAGPSAANIRTALGLASANVDTQLAAINSKTTNLPSAPADESLIIAATNALSSQIGALPAPLDAAGTRSAVGLGSANLDTQLAEIEGETDAIPTAIQNADALLDRNMATGSDSSSDSVRTPRSALRAMRNKVDLSTTPGVVFKEDDVTQSHTLTITTDAAALPITKVDPG